MAERLAQDANLPTISEEVDEFVAKTGLQDQYDLNTNMMLRSRKC